MRVLSSVVLVVYISTLESSLGSPILDQHIQPLAPFSLSPGNVNLETHWPEKYRDEEGENLPAQLPNARDDSPSSLPTVANNADGSDEESDEVLSRQRREPQYYQHGGGHHGGGHHGGGHHGGGHYGGGHGHYNPHGGHGHHQNGHHH